MSYDWAQWATQLFPYAVGLAVGWNAVQVGKLVARKLGTRLTNLSCRITAFVFGGASAGLTWYETVGPEHAIYMGVFTGVTLPLGVKVAMSIAKDRFPTLYEYMAVKRPNQCFDETGTWWK